MSILYDTKMGPRAEVLNGCYLSYRRQYFWLTAGHILTWFEELRGQNVIRSAHWLQELGITNQPGFPVDAESLAIAPVDSNGIDIGIAHISEFPAGAALLASDEISPLTNKDFIESPREFAGYYLVGPPITATKLTQVHPKPGYVDYCTRTGFCLLPIDRAYPPFDGVEEEFCANKDAFYGRLRDFDRLTDGPATIKGMSGGPIFGVFRDADKVRLSFVAIQSGWAKSKRIIRATAKSQIRSVLDAICRQIASFTAK